MWGVVDEVPSCHCSRFGSCCLGEVWLLIYPFPSLWIDASGHYTVLRVRRKLHCVAELYELLQRLARRHDTILFLRLSSRSSTSGSQCPDVQLLFGRAARDTTWQAIAGSRARDLCFFKRKFSFTCLGGLPHCQQRCLPLLFLRRSVTKELAPEWSGVVETCCGRLSCWQWGRPPLVHSWGWGAAQARCKGSVFF